jgi:hypothetical protein
VSAVRYEVTLHVRADVAVDFGRWLHAHVGEMVALPGFTGASIGRQRDPGEEGAVVYCCAYRLRDADALDAYLRDHAPRMRDDGLRRFPGAFTATRRVFDVIADIGADVGRD